MNVKQLINELNEHISKNYRDFKGTYLYGSRVRGNFKPDSDIDLISLFEWTDREKESYIYDAIVDLEYKYDIFIDFQQYTYEELRKNPVFYDQVVNKGIFYAAGT